MINCTIRTSAGEERNFDFGKEHCEKSIASIVQECGVDIPVSCCAGACFVCGARVISGQQYLDQTVGGEPLVDLDEGEFLTCIGGFDSQSLSDTQTHNVIIEVIN